MIAEPGRWTEEFLDAGCDSITFHVEVEAPQVRPALERIREAGRAAGPVGQAGRRRSSALDAYRDLLDIVLVMTVEPGFGGQAFMADVADAKLGPARELARSRGRVRGPGRRRRQASRPPRHRARRDGRHRRRDRRSTGRTTWRPRSSGSGAIADAAGAAPATLAG